MQKTLNYIFLILILLMIGIHLEAAKSHAIEAETLSADTIKIKLYGYPINYAPALNIKVSFSNPNVAMLDSSAPVFQANGVNSLLTESDSLSGVISVVWDEIIQDNEATITAKLAPGLAKGFTTISIDKVESVGGFDITDKIVVSLDTPSVINTKGTVFSSIGDFTLIENDRLIGPGQAAVAFHVENMIGALVAELNGKSVDFTNEDIGVAIVDLPNGGGKLNFILKVRSSDSTEQILNLGNQNVSPGVNIGLPPRLYRARVLNDGNSPKLELFGRGFGVIRFGEENTKVEIVPHKEGDSVSKRLYKRYSKNRIEDENCINEGSYVNISHLAGSAARKINVLGHCN